MTILSVLVAVLHSAAWWVQTPDGNNALFALICLAGLIGVPTRICVAITLLVHLLLILI